MKPEFLFCEAKEIPGAGLIICTDYPFYVAKVFRFETDEQLRIFANKYDIFRSSGKVDFYRILICAVGTISDFGDTPKMIQRPIFNDMAKFYENEKVKGNETRLKRYRETQG